MTPTMTMMREIRGRGTLDVLYCNVTSIGQDWLAGWLAV